jgi:hypothetical protein
MCVPKEKVAGVLVDLHSRGEIHSKVIGKTILHGENNPWIRLI